MIETAYLEREARAMNAKKIVIGLIVIAIVVTIIINVAG